MNPDAQAAEFTKALFGIVWSIVKVGYFLLILVFLLQIRNHLRDLKGIIIPKKAPGS
jgi:uncharacterized integral membrane protein